MKHRLSALALMALPALLAAPVAAQVGMSSARGLVEDAAGNPMEGVVVGFTARGNPTNTYTGTTNKNGRYFVSGLYTPKEDDRWDITVDKEGYVPIRIVVVSRAANKVLAGELDRKIGADGKLPDIVIRPLGEAQVNLTLVTAAEAAEVEVAVAPPADPDAASASASAPQPPQKDPWDEAVLRVSNGDLAGSLDLFREAIEDEPEDPERHEALAKVLYQLDRLTEAEAEGRKAVELAPQRLDSHMVLYTIYFGLDRLEQAGETLEAALAIAPEDRRVLEQLAFVSQQTGNTARAVDAQQKITELEPDNASAWLALGDLYAKKGDLTRSEAAYRKVVELNPDEAYQTFYNLGVLIVNRANGSEAETRRAIDAFRRAIQIKPDYAAAQQQLGLALLGVGDQSGARAALEAYLQLKPKAPDAGQMEAILQALPR